MKAASERNVAGVRTPAKRLRGSSWRQPSTPTVSNATPAITRIAESRVDARTQATIALAAPVPAGVCRCREAVSRVDVSTGGNPMDRAAMVDAVSMARLLLPRPR
jgi:hypothetical protein